MSKPADELSIYEDVMEKTSIRAPASVTLQTTSASTPRHIVLPVEAIVRSSARSIRDAADSKA